jgi:hypothetical protein
MTLASAATDNTTVLHLRDIIIQQTNLGLAKKGPSLGDQFIYGGDVFRGGKKVGTDSVVVCTFTRLAGANTQTQCQITLSLPEGQLTAQGLLPTGALNVLAITGGTGVYRDAGGYVTGKPAGTAPSSPRSWTTSPPSGGAPPPGGSSRQPETGRAGRALGAADEPPPPVGLWRRMVIHDLWAGNRDAVAPAVGCGACQWAGGCSGRANSLPWITGPPSYLPRLAGRTRL